MANVKPNNQEGGRYEAFEAKLSKTEQFFKENQKLIWGIVGAIVIIGACALAYSKFIYQPKCAEAQEQAFPAEISFQSSEYELALNGDGNVPGFAQIIDQYGAKAGKAVYLYAGICELQLGNFENALSYLKKYNGKDEILAGRAESCKGDAYVGLGDYDTAVSCFKNAVKVNGDNVLAATYYQKAGLAYEALGKKAEALDCYKTIEDRYPQSVEAYDIAKFIARVSE